MLQVEYVLCPQSLYLIRMSNFPRSLGTRILPVMRRLIRTWSYPTQRDIKKEIKEDGYFPYFSHLSHTYCLHKTEDNVCALYVCVFDHIQSLNILYAVEY